MFSGSTVLLTGVGGEGQVGEVVAAAFADLGASLVLVDRTAAKVEARAAALQKRGRVARAYACDLTDAKGVAALADTVRANHGPGLHALVHMAGGFAMSGPLAESALDVWDKQLAINLTTAMLATRAFLPALRLARGSIVLFASQAALPGATGAKMSAYAVAKTGVAALMRAIAAEERASGVRANAVAPASIRTAANLSSMGPNEHYVEREEVASVVTFLCSTAASAVTGELIPLS
ncbi:MAG: SDR family NAD(P)-dependent oxidoreductase [Gemmatimonadaceae bacterium]